VKPKVTEIARGIHRISTFHPDIGIQFNQFLVADDEPFLMHTGMRRMFASTLGGVREVLDPDPAPVTEGDVVAPAAAAIREGAKGPLANDMPWTPSTDATLRRLAALEPRTLAVMHGSSFRGDGRRAILELAGVIAEVLGKPPP
jgi:hypothetical protein